MEPTPSLAGPGSKTPLGWTKQYRIVASQFPTISLYEQLVPAEQLAVLYELEALTNPRLQEEAGNLNLVRREDHVSGPGASPVMAAFTHIGQASRFTDGSYGVYYAANSEAAAIAETRFHRERFLAATNEPSCEITQRVYVGELQKPLHDIRASSFDHLHQPDPGQYSITQRFASELRKANSWGLLYRSVRHPNSECIAAFRPPAISLPKQGRHLRYVWDGAEQRITNVLEVRNVVAS